MYSGGSVCTGVGIPIYLRESLKGPKWLIPEVAQPQVPPSEKTETHYVRFCVCPHTTKPKIEVQRKVWCS